MSVSGPGNTPDLSAYIPGWSNLPRAQREAVAAPVLASESEGAGGGIQPDFWENVVTVSGPGGAQPYNPRYYASEAGADWLGQQAAAAAERLGVANPGVTQRPTFESGPFTAPPQRMLGDTNAGDLLVRIEIFGQEWGKRAIEAIVRRASTEQA